MSLFLFIVFASVAQIIVNLVGNLGFHQFARSAAGKTWGSLFAEIIALLIWWLFNRYYLKGKIGWHGEARDWLLLLPVIVILIGDSFLGTNFNFAPSNMIYAVLFGLAVGACEEYLFRGILVSYLLQHFRLSALLTACLSGVGFGLIHLINGFSSGNWTNTFAQALMAIGVGFFLAAVYLLTNNLCCQLFFMPWSMRLINWPLAPSVILRALV
ncbi:CPBP family intramembrane glutamic endopeptidase [Secundilactobacillus odoratitofui]|uniref:CPBP family intramembrane glutamic endopeptidase n=1 Tax=Secundilactobacillus odoratitofui TaxID=480930 RepID=UPI0020936DD2|nr:CPBP family intramembrane glutamic endopeptidase [Secundilactobacillus odoratitofui]